MQRVQAVPRDGGNAELALVRVVRHVGSGGAEVADDAPFLSENERDRRRNVDHVRRQEIF